LAGGSANASVLRSEDDTEKRRADSKRNMLDNVPPGITISRLEYPVFVDGKKAMSTLILLGVK
jgi:hypothetical protein